MNQTIIKKRLFGDQIEIIIFDTDENIAKDIVDEMYLEALRLQKIFNIYDKGSEISILNQKRELEVSNELLYLIKKAIFFCKKTHGEYDISIGKRILERKKSGENINSNCSYKDIKINGNIVSLNHLDVILDLGSLAKGHITDKMVEFLLNKGLGEFLIDSRGDIRLVGKYTHIIGVQHPRDRSKNICKLSLKNHSVATSGDYNQFHKKYERSHIINQKEIISLTVVAKTLEEADVYATTLFVSNKKLREELIKKNKKIKVMTINKNNEIKYYNGFRKFIIKD